MAPLSNAVPSQGARPKCEDNGTRGLGTRNPTRNPKLQPLTWRYALHLDLHSKDAIIRCYPFAAPLTYHLVRELFPGFDERTAHLLSPGIFPNLKRLDFNGDEFHWVLAKSLCLKELHLTRPCSILPDDAPHEANPTLTSLSLVNRSSILNPSVDRHETLSKLLAHFPSLQSLIMTIYDADHDEMHSETEGDLNSNDHGNFAVLLWLL